jgi:hypothetical protein
MPDPDGGSCPRTDTTHCPISRYQLQRRSLYTRRQRDWLLIPLLGWDNPRSRPGRNGYLPVAQLRFPAQPDYAKCVIAQKAARRPGVNRLMARGAAGMTRHERMISCRASASWLRSREGADPGRRGTAGRLARPGEPAPRLGASRPRPGSWLLMPGSPGSGYHVPVRTGQLPPPEAAAARGGGLRPPSLAV